MMSSIRIARGEKYSQANFSVNVFSTKVYLVGDTIFASSTYWKWDCILYVFILRQAKV